MNSDNNKIKYETSNDGRKQYNYDTRYPSNAKKQIKAEAVFLFLLLFITLILIFLFWKDDFICLFKLSEEKELILKKYALYALSGLLGGVIFNIKYFYRAVARGYWNQDRVYWRIFTPFVSMVIALVVGTMVSSCLININKTNYYSTMLFVGFLAGYFADEAVGKMYEIAQVIFGKTSTIKDFDDSQE